MDARKSKFSPVTQQSLESVDLDINLTLTLTFDKTFCPSRKNMTHDFSCYSMSN